MKKVSMFVLAVIISIAFVSTTFAQAPAGTTEKKETTTTTTTTKTKAMKFHGKVTNMDTAAKMMTVTGKKGDMTFDVSNAKIKGEINVGDKVGVKYMEQDGKMAASAVKVIKGKKMKTTTTKTTTEKKEETTAPAK
jgi:hypothetical protein